MDGSWSRAGKNKNKLERQVIKSEKSNNQSMGKAIPQLLFQKQANSLSEVISAMENPFKDESTELIILHIRNSADDAVVSIVQTIEDLNIGNM